MLEYKLDRTTFDATKRLLLDPNVLAYFNIKKKMWIVSDASRVGLGYVLLQEHMKDCADWLQVPLISRTSLCDSGALAVSHGVCVQEIQDPGDAQCK